MKNKYYDEWEFKQAVAYIEKNPLVAKSKLEQYLIKYKNDCSAYVFYTSSLISLGEFDIAEKALAKANELYEEDKNCRKVTKQSKVKLDLVTTTIRLLIYQEKYKDAFAYVKQYYSYLKANDFDFGPITFYCRKKLGMIDENRREGHTYIFRQIVSYQEQDFLEHIKKHLSNTNVNLEAPNSCIFSEEFPLEQALVEIKKHLLSPTRMYPNFYVDIYTFKYDGCGTINGELANYFNVVCFHNTSDIITIYPDEYSQDLPYIDLNHINKNYSAPKVKTLSQIDKFNKRYGPPKNV